MGDPKLVVAPCITCTLHNVTTFFSATTGIETGHSELVASAASRHLVNVASLGRDRRCVIFVDWPAKAMEDEVSTQETHHDSDRDVYGTLRVTLILAIITMVILLVLGISHWIDGVATVLSAILLAIFAAFHVWISAYKPTRLKREHTGASSHLDLQLLDQAAKSYIANWSDAQILGYVDAVNNPTRLRVRLSEKIEPLTRTVRQSVSITVGISEDQKDSILLPVAMPVKGDLTDDLQVRLDGKNIATLSYREYLLLTVASLKSLVTAVEGGISGSGKLSSKDEREKKLTDLKHAAAVGIKLVALQARLDDTGKKDLANCTEMLRSLGECIDDNESKIALRATIGLMRTLAGHYAILAVIPKEENSGGRPRILEYERYQLPSLKLAGLNRPHRWLRDRMAALLGVRPIYLELDLSNAATARSFHLMVVGPEGTYLGWQSLPHSANEFQVSQGDNGPAPFRSYKRFQRRRGQRYLHLYMRDVKRTLAAKLKLSVKFYELPPGSMASATLAASGTFFLVYLVAVVGGRNPSPQGVSFTAVLLAFPAIIGLFAGFESRSTGLVNGTLSSRALSLVTILVCLSAMGLLVAQAAGSIKRTEHKPILGIADIWWQWVVLVALFNILFALYIWITRTMHFYWLADRPDDQPSNGTRWFT